MASGRSDRQPPATTGCRPSREAAWTNQWTNQQELPASSRHQFPSKRPGQEASQPPRCHGSDSSNLSDSANYPGLDLRFRLHQPSLWTDVGRTGSRLYPKRCSESGDALAPATYFRDTEPQGSRVPSPHGRLMKWHEGPTASRSLIPSLHAWCGERIAPERGRAELAHDGAVGSVSLLALC